MKEWQKLVYSSQEKQKSFVTHENIVFHGQKLSFCGATQIDEKIIRSYPYHHMRPMITTGSRRGVAISKNERFVNGFGTLASHSKNL